MFLTLRPVFRGSREASPLTHDRKPSRCSGSSSSSTSRPASLIRSPACSLPQSRPPEPKPLGTRTAPRDRPRTTWDPLETPHKVHARPGHGDWILDHDMDYILMVPLVIRPRSRSRTAPLLPPTHTRYRDLSPRSFYHTNLRISSFRMRGRIPS